MAEARELAQRSTGTDNVRLLWHPESNRVEVSVHNSRTGAELHIDVAPGSALDAFYHPYAYAARRGDRPDRLTPSVGLKG